MEECNMRNEVEAAAKQYAKVVLWEKGFAQYNAVIDEACKTDRNRVVTRKLNDAIRMMAEADYQGLIDLLGDIWIVRSALHGRTYEV